MKKTQEKILVSNMFLDVIFLIMSFWVSIFRALGVFLGIRSIGKEKKGTLFIKKIDFFILEWPKYFSQKPSLYKITRFFGDTLHALFLKK